MSAVPETLPALAERADAAYLDFVEGFREYILGKGADFEDRLNTVLLAEQARRGSPGMMSSRSASTCIRCRLVGCGTGCHARSRR